MFSTRLQRQIAFTMHALHRMAERSVTQEQVLAVIEAPASSHAAAHGRLELRGLIDRQGKPMLLRVILDAQGAVLTVVTVIATSKIAKYGATAP